MAGDEPGESRLPHGRLRVRAGTALCALSSLACLVRARTRVRSPRRLTLTLNRLNAHVNAQFAVNSPVRCRTPPFPTNTPGARSRHSPSLPRLYVPVLARPPRRATSTTTSTLPSSTPPSRSTRRRGAPRSWRPRGYRSAVVAGRAVVAGSSGDGRGYRRAVVAGSSGDSSGSSHAHGEPKARAATSSRLTLIPTPARTPTTDPGPGRGTGGRGDLRIVRGVVLEGAGHRPRDRQAPPCAGACRSPVCQRSVRALRPEECRVPPTHLAQHVVTRVCKLVCTFST